MGTRWWNKLRESLKSFRAYLRNPSGSNSGSGSAPMMRVIVAQILAGNERPPGSLAPLLREFPAALHEEFERKLLELETSALASPDPQRFLRAALLDYTEVWIVTAFLDPIKWGRDGNPADVYAAATMTSLLGQRFDYAHSPSAYCMHGLGAEALHRYLEILDPMCFSSGWRAGYRDGIYERTTWLQSVVDSFATVGVTPTGEHSILPDGVILDRWTTWMLDTRTRALEDPIAFGKGKQFSEYRF